MRKLLKKRNNQKLKYRFNNYFMYQLSKGIQELVMDKRHSRKATRMEPIWKKCDLMGWTSSVRYQKNLDGRIKVSTFREWSLVDPFEEGEV
ncbi:hypothetical protein NVP1170O_091 [Vibrio phage 1.170.O._10N.261.52.C3]|nr:hypothetical protein NVP1170O_091 [Vibrio phage 1.170.O._10N.261.52.C3]